LFQDIQSVYGWRIKQEQEMRRQDRNTNKGHAIALEKHAEWNTKINEMNNKLEKLDTDCKNLLNELIKVKKAAEDEQHRSSLQLCDRIAYVHGNVRR
jgi:DNA anti-recombination protein RmuC